ncbi:MAG TPA: glycosyltransferase [Terriglobales bacterium]|jgi:spore maturation protein CgeB
MTICLFAHSWLSDWNHGNAHFLRGLASALVARGHVVRCYETGRPGWSLAHLKEESRGAASVLQFRNIYPELDLHFYDDATDWPRTLGNADIVVAHEWNPASLFHALAAARRRRHFRLLLHDTHHRAVSQEAAMAQLPLEECDAVLAFGESLRRLYEQRGMRAFTLHEAADARRFHPAEGAGAAPAAWDMVWIGNWGDGERSREITEFLLEPAAALRLRTLVHGVRYPVSAQAELLRCGIRFGGYLPNLEAPALYHASRLAVHIPRRPYVERLPGIPTIRMFEALACGATLLSGPWQDTEGLFAAGADFISVRSKAEMAATCKQLLADEGQRKRVGQHGAETILARHTCDDRARELEDICRNLD